MNVEYFQELGLKTANLIETVEYIKRCMENYENVLKAMGLIRSEVLEEFVDNSQITYLIPFEVA